MTKSWFYSIITFRIFLIALFAIAWATGFCQKKTSSPSIFYHSDTLFSDKSNAIAIVVDNDIKQKIQVTFSQGRAYSIDNQIFLVDSLKNGSVTISAFKLDNGKKVLIETRKFKVVTSNEQLVYDRYRISPGINLKGYLKGDVPLSVFKTANRLNINPEFKILNYVAYLSGPSGADTQMYFLESEIFDGDFVSILQKLRKGTTVTFTEIKFKDKRGTIIEYPGQLSFKVIDN